MTIAPAPTQKAPILRAEQARVAIDGVVAIDRLTCVTLGDHVLCVGDVDALVAAVTGVALRTGVDGTERDDGPFARVIGGVLAIAGRDVHSGAHREVLGCAPLDPPLPSAWTAEEYVVWSARLAGIGARLAAELAGSALTRVGLGAARKRVLRTFALAERRVLLLAQAIVVDPPVILAEAPLSGLDGGAAAFVSSALVRATEGRGALLTVGRLDPGTPEGEFARGASYVLLLSGGELALEGAPGELFGGVRIYGLTVRTNVEPLRAELAAHGVVLRGGPLRFSVALPPGATSRHILLAATRARAAVVEMVPLV